MTDETNNPTPGTPHEVGEAPEASGQKPSFDPWGTEPVALPEEAAEGGEPPVFDPWGAGGEAFGAGAVAETGAGAPPAPWRTFKFDPRIAAVVVAAVALLAVVLALWFVAYPVIIDGSVRFVSRDTTVAGLARRGEFAAPAGDLLAVDGRVVRPGGGGLPVVSLGDMPLAPDSPVPPGAWLTSARGSDMREDVVTRIVSIEPSITYFGTGAVQSVASIGSPGEARVTMGEVSRIELAREVITEPVPRVILRGIVARGPKYIALTFDDGPWPGQTEKIVDILARKGVKATFFMLGMNVQRNPSLAKLVAGSGNEIATHSQTHKLLKRAPKATSIYEISTGAKTVQRYTGVKPYWYRPAGGSVNPFVYTEADALGLKLILWNLDTHDYRKPGAPVLVSRVVGNAKHGSVVLMHDGGGDRSQTIAALPAIIDTLRARGFLFVTLTELYDRPNPPKMPVR